MQCRKELPDLNKRPMKHRTKDFAGHERTPTRNITDKPYKGSNLDPLFSTTPREPRGSLCSSRMDLARQGRGDGRGSELAWSWLKGFVRSARFKSARFRSARLRESCNAIRMARAVAVHGELAQPQGTAAPRAARICLVGPSGGVGFAHLSGCGHRSSIRRT